MLTAKQQRIKKLEQRVTEEKERLKNSATGAAAPESRLLESSSIPRVLEFAGVGSSTPALSRSKAEENSRSVRLASPEKSNEKKPVRFVPEAALALSGSKAEENSRSVRLASPEKKLSSSDEKKSVRFVPTVPTVPTEAAPALSGSKSEENSRSVRYVSPDKPDKPEKTKNWFLSLFDFEKKDPPARPKPEKDSMEDDMLFGVRQKNPSASSTTTDVEGSEMMRRSSLKVASEGKASVRSSLKASERSSSPGLFGSNSQEELEAFAFVPGNRLSRSQNFAKSLEKSMRPSSQDDSQDRSGSNLRSSSRKELASNREVVVAQQPPVQSITLSSASKEETALAPLAFAALSSSKECSVEDMKIINRLRELVETDDFLVYLRDKQSDSGLEGKKFIDFLESLSITPDMSYQKYVQNYEEAYEYEVDRQMRSLLSGENEEVFSSLRAIFPIIPAKHIIEILVNFPKAHEDELVVKLKSFPEELCYERESNHSFKEAIRAAIKENKTTKVKDDGDCFFECISIGLNLLGEEGRYTAKRVREEISRAEFNHFNSVAFRKPTMSFPIGYGVFSNWTDVELVNLTKSINDETGLKIGDGQLGDITDFPVKTVVNFGLDAYNVEIVESNRQDNSAPEHVFKFKTPNEYAAIMGISGVHGTNVEMMVAARLYNVTIVVYIANMEEFHYYFPKKEDCGNGRIIYLFKTHAIGHFDVVNMPDIFKIFNHYGLPIASYISDSCVRRQPVDTEEIENAGQLSEKLNQAIYAYMSMIDSEGHSKKYVNSDDTIQLIPYGKLEGDERAKTRRMRYFTKLGVLFFEIPEEMEIETFNKYFDDDDDDDRFIEMYNFVLQNLRKYNQWVTRGYDQLDRSKRAARLERQPSERAKAAAAGEPGLLLASESMTKHGQPVSAKLEQQLSAVSSERETAAAAAELGSLAPLAASVKYPSEQIKAYNIVRARSSPASTKSNARPPLPSSLVLQPDDQKLLQQQQSVSHATSAPESVSNVSALLASFDTPVAASSASLQQQEQLKNLLQQRSSPESILDRSAARLSQFTRSNARPPLPSRQPDDQQQMRERLLQENELRHNLLKEQEQLLLLLQQQQQQSVSPATSSASLLQQEQKQEQLKNLLLQQKPATSNVSALRAKFQPMSPQPMLPVSVAASAASLQQQDLKLKQQLLLVSRDIIPRVEEELAKEKALPFQDQDSKKINRMEALLREHRDDLARLGSNFKGGKMTTTRQTRQRRGKNAKMTAGQTRQRRGKNANMTTNMQTRRRRGKNAKMTTTKQTRQRREKNAKMTTRRRRN
jgi:hypothetical protein